MARPFLEAGTSHSFGAHPSAFSSMHSPTNLGSFMRILAMPEAAEPWSLTRKTRWWRSLTSEIRGTWTEMIYRIKSVMRRVLPSLAFSELRNLCDKRRIYNNWIAAFTLGMKFILQRSPLPNTLLFFGLSPGDDLLCSAVLREKRKRGENGLVVISNHAELFTGNDDVDCIWPAGDGYYDGSIVSDYERFSRLWRSKFQMITYAPFDGVDRSESPSRHIVADMCASAGISGAVSIRTYLSLTEQEKEAAKWAAGQIVIQSSGLGARLPMKNKQWYEERFQGVIDALCNEYYFIQLGTGNDPALLNVTDLRGSTSIRESAAILYNARLYVGTVGFLMHLARAVECPSVIVYGGREAPWQSGYVCNANIYSAIPCAPCWQWNSCDFDRRCMTKITVSDVVCEIRQMLQKERNPLAVEAVEI